MGPGGRRLKRRKLPVTAGERHLVAGDDTVAGLHQLRIAQTRLLAGRTVDEDRIGNRQVGQSVAKRPRTTFIQRRCIHAGRIEQIAAAVGQAADAQIFPRSGGYLVVIFGNHMNQSPADRAISRNEQVDGLKG